MGNLSELNFRTNLVGVLLAVYKKCTEMGKDQEFSFEHCVVNYTPGTGLQVSVPKAVIMVRDYRYDAVQLGSSIRNAGDIPHHWLESLAEGDLIERS